MRRIATLALVVLALLAPSLVHAHTPAQFVPMMRKVFPKAQEFRPRLLHLSDQPDLCRRAERASGTKLAGKDLHIPVFDVYSGGQRIGVAWMTEVEQGNDFVGVIVGSDLKGRIVAVALDAGPPSVDNAAFLGQFRGKTAKSPLKVGRDVKAAPQDPALSQRIATAVRKAIAVETEVLRG